MSLDGKSGEFRLFAPDFPDWIEEDGVGIKLAPDTRTTDIMKRVLKELENNRPVYKLFERLALDHSESNTQQAKSFPPISIPNLNESQQQAVSAIIDNEDIVIVHGPPGTGKTTT